MSIDGKPVTGRFEKTMGWLDWRNDPSRPRFRLPVGAVDAHGHVFGPAAEFPYPNLRDHMPDDGLLVDIPMRLY